ncbi:MAG: prolipoprotein diacylglyceryl transferase [Mycobacteriales bacterium]
MVLAYIPSPSTGVLHLGPIPLRAYAFCIIVGIVAGVLLAERRWVARGGRRGTIGDLAVVTVPAGLIGGRLYHVITSPQAYFGKGGDPVAALYVWRGGLGIWGAVLLGVSAGLLFARRRGIVPAALVDACAPSIVIGQALGRFGNYFNQELYGRPTHLPWALRIDPANRPAATPDIGLYHPTFLYESLWDFGVAGLVIWADRRYRLGGGRAFALYVAAYTVGRGWIEAVRVDDASRFFGLRLNDYTSIVVFLAAVAYLLATRGRKREETVEPPAAEEPATA